MKKKIHKSKRKFNHTEKRGRQQRNVENVTGDKEVKQLVRALKKKDAYKYEKVTLVVLVTASFIIFNNYLPNYSFYKQFIVL